MSSIVIRQMADGVQLRGLSNNKRALAADVSDSQLAVSTKAHVEVVTETVAGGFNGTK
jgi:hypothetical protein